MSFLILPIPQSVTQKKSFVSVDIFFLRNLSKEQLKVSDNINIDQLLGSGIY